MVGRRLLFVSCFRRERLLKSVAESTINEEIDQKLFRVDARDGASAGWTIGRIQGGRWGGGQKAPEANV